MSKEFSPGPKVRLTFQEAIDLLNRAVAEKGSDFIYAPPEIHRDRWDCAYFDPQTGEPSCLVGHVLAYKGMTFDDIKPHNTEAGVALLVKKGVLEVDGLHTKGLLEVVQNAQDIGIPWGSALDEALASYEQFVKDLYGGE